MRWSVCFSKSQWILCVSFSRTHIPFGSMAKFQFLARFPVVYISYLICTSFLHSFMGLTVWSLSTLTIILRIIDFCLNIIGPYGVVLCCYLKRFSFSGKVSISQPCPGLLGCNIKSLPFEISMVFYSFFLPISVSQFLLFFCLFLCW